MQQFLIRRLAGEVPPGAVADLGRRGASTQLIAISPPRFMLAIADRVFFRDPLIKMRVGVVARAHWTRSVLCSLVC